MPLPVKKHTGTNDYFISFTFEHCTGVEGPCFCSFLLHHILMGRNNLLLNKH